mgnify:CR=1 FL=1
MQSPTLSPTGNGALGVRIASEDGGTQALRIFVDHVLRLNNGHRLPTGYFRLHLEPQTSANAHQQLRVELRQRLFDATLIGNVFAVDDEQDEVEEPQRRKRKRKTENENEEEEEEEEEEERLVMSFELFVQADYNESEAATGAVSGQGAMFMRIVYDSSYRQQSPSSSSSSQPLLEWVPVGKQPLPFAWQNETTAINNNSSTEVTVIASLVSTSVGDANASLMAAVDNGFDREYQRSAEWWRQYWQQTYVSMASTKLEGFYAVELYRLGSFSFSFSFLLNVEC